MEITLKKLIDDLQYLAHQEEQSYNLYAADLIREAIKRLKQTGRRARG